jgi:hypothetical protein
MEEMKEFNKDLCKVQAELVNAKKTKTNPHFRSSYADLDSYIKESRPVLSKYGFSVTQNHDLTDDYKTILITKLKHISGHQEISKVLLEPKDKTNPQQLASYNTYMRRMCFASILNLSSYDDDGETATRKESISAKQYLLLAEALKDKKDKIKTILGRLSVENLEDMTKDKFNAVLEYAKRKETDTTN